MQHTYHKIPIHLVWSTKGRYPYIRPEIREQLQAHIRHNAAAAKIRLDCVNARPEHVHCLVDLDPAMSVAQAVNLIKGESSHWLNQQKLTKDHFAWQTGYSAFSVSREHQARVRGYINNQDRHHEKLPYDGELERLGGE